MGESILAALALTCCVVLLGRMLLGAPRRRRVDAAALRAWVVTRDAVRRLWHWRSSRREAAAAAEAAIRRARHSADRDGNVITPRAFRGPRKPH